jgi:choline dehydrogenase-like flavoprotein
MRYEADFVVVGAGSAGCAVARRLIDETDATVLVLEAGESDLGIAAISNPERWIENLGTSRDWNYSYAPTPRIDNRSIPLARGKVLGGSSSINAMLWTRGNRNDYDGWAAMGNEGWDYESLLPLFKKAEDWEGGETPLRGAGGPVRVERPKSLNPVAQALVDAGLSYGMPYLDDINTERPEGVGPMNRNVKDGKRCSMSEAYLHPIMNHDRLMVITGAHVTRLQMSGTRCFGVNFVKDGIERTVRAYHEVVLSAGAIDTPRLLLLSGIGPHNELKKLGIATKVNLPGVGQNLQEHVLFAGLCFEPKKPLPGASPSSEGSLIFWKSQASLPTPDLMFLSLQVPYVSPELAAVHPVAANAFSIMPCLVRIESRGYLRMQTSRFDGPLEIQPNFLSVDSDVNAMLSAMEMGLELASQPAFRELTGSWAIPPKRINREEMLSLLRRGCSAHFHPVGTCAMGNGKLAVVDSKLRIHGVQGVRIADASIMPTIPSADTNAASVVIGEKAAQMIVQNVDATTGGRTQQHFVLPHYSA